ncbi:DNA-binding protein, partial [Streptomyces pharetrae CZA14]
AAGEKLPTLAVTLAYVAACGGNADDWEKRWRAVTEELAAMPREDAGAEESPYRGLTRFEPGDADVFFGRDQLIENLLALVRAHRSVVVLGPSGSGKSSLLRAGLIPRLSEGAGLDTPLAAIRILTPGAHPVRTHAERLRPAGKPGDTLVLVDQFEEVFTLCTDPAERAEFIDLLLTSQDPASRLRVVLGVRADFYSRSLEHPELVQVVREAGIPVGPPSREELREVIVRPATARGLTVERTLTAQLLDEVTGEPGGLPLLSHALLETWRRRSGRMLTLKAYEAAGGVRGAIAQTAEDAYGSLSTERADVARLVMLRLVTPGEGAQDTRRPVHCAELDFAPEEEVDAVLDRLVSARLLTLDDGTVELAHEALITAWPRLAGWIDGARERLVVHRRLTDAARTWDDLGREPGALYRGTRLATASEQLSDNELTPLERDFLTASEAAFTAESRR